MTPAQLSRTVLLSLHGEVDDAGRPVALPARVVVESPPRRGSGDYATGVALQLARSAGLDARALAARLGRGLERRPGIGRAEVSGAGFLNVTLDAQGRTSLVRELAAGPDRSAPDDPARDAASWAAATGDAGGAAGTTALLVRTDASTLFRVQYAHARARAVLRNAADLGLHPEPGAGGHAYDAPAERALLALLADQARIAEAGDPARLARHLTAVADAYRDARYACPPLPLGAQKPGAVHRARLALAEATGTVLADGLSQLGVTAPAHL